MSTEHSLLDDRYRIGKSISTSPFLQVYSGTDTALNRHVVIKALTPNLASQDRLAKHFLERAESAGRITHENFVRIFDSGKGEFTASGTSTYSAPYVVMEEIETTPLRAAIDAAQLSITDATTIGQTVLNALEYVHRMGILHGSINPETVLLTPDRTVKIDNVSLALSLRHGNISQNELGLFLGDQSTIAPEYLTASSNDGRIDLYATGAVLYEMLTAEPPYKAVGDSTIVEEQLSHLPERPDTLNPFVNEYLSDLVLKSLADDPDQRFQTAATFAQALTSKSDVSIVPKEASPLTMLEDRPESLNATTTIDDLEQAVKRGALTDTSAIELPLVDAPTTQERRAWKRLAFWGGGAVIIAAMLYAVLALTTNGSFDTGTVSVNDVSGQTEVQAVATLKQQSLRSTIVTEKSDTVESGRVIRTEPEAGIVVSKSTSIEIVVSAGKNPSTVPDLSDTSGDDLASTLEKAGLKLGQQTTVDSPSVPTGFVVSQSPVAGASVSAGSSVDVQLSSGKVTIPNVKGKTYDAAINLLQDDLGLVVNPVPDYVCSGKMNRISSQNPKPGKVEQGTSITIKYTTQSSLCN